MKRFLFFAVVLLTALTCSATINKANMKVAYTAKTAGKVDFTVLNKAGDKGFVILDSQDQVLGYSDAGKFEYDKMPENLKWWLSQYQEQINWARTNSIKVAPVKALSDSDSIIVQPLLGETEWDQTDPYYRECPMVGNYRSVVGCEATAVSQIMYRHKWPMRGHGYYEYAWAYGGTVSRNFCESVYDWDNILPQYHSDEYNNDQANAVARLCADVGIALNMQYSPSGSGTQSTYAIPALTRYFGYSSKMQLLMQRGFTMEEWEEKIMTELDASRPVLYSGMDDSGAGGHAFVCDGYTRDGFFHFNWGWSGDGNGYFKIRALNVGKYKFNSDNDIVIGIQPRISAVVDGVCYEITSDSTVMFTYRDDEEYAAPVVVPSEVTIEDVTYRVEGMMPGTLPVTDCVPSVQVPWTSPVDFSLTKNVFSKSIYENTVLIVPDNCVEKYAIDGIWGRFKCIKDTIGHCISYGEWENYADGIGTFIYSSNPYYTLGGMGEKDPGLPVLYRKCETAEGKGQFWIQHWSIDTDLIIDYDSITGNCIVPKQYAGFELTDNIVYYPIFVSDIPVMFPEDSYDEYPCYYDAKNGLFTLCLQYVSKLNGEYVDFGYGIEKFQVDGFDTSISATYDYEKTFGKKIGVRIKAATTLKTFKYVFVEGEISQDSVAVVAQQIADSLISSKDAYAGVSSYKPASLSTTYTMVIAGFDVNGNFRNYTSTIVNYNDIYNMKFGDANKDDAIDVSDITTTAAYILGDKPANFNRFSADMDNDGVITVSDITAIAAMILGNE